MTGNVCLISCSLCSCLQAVNNAASRLVTVMPAIHVLLFIICSYCFPFLIQYRINAGVLIPWCSIGMAHKRYEFLHASFISHSETFAQSFRPQVVILHKAVDATCACFTEKVIQKFRCRFMRQSLALEALVEMPAHVECVGFFTQCKTSPIMKSSSFRHTA